MPLFALATSRSTSNTLLSKSSVSKSFHNRIVISCTLAVHNKSESISAPLSKCIRLFQPLVVIRIEQCQEINTGENLCSVSIPMNPLNRWEFTSGTRTSKKRPGTFFFLCQRTILWARAYNIVRFGVFRGEKIYEYIFLPNWGIVYCGGCSSQAQANAATRLSKFRKHTRCLC